MKFLLLLLFLTHSCSIDLVIPLSGKDSEKFNVKVQTLINQPDYPAGDLLLKLLSYEPRNGELIRKIVYHGVTIFQDRTERPVNFRRRLLSINCRNFLILIVTSKMDTTTYEGVFYIRHETIIHSIEDSERLTNILSGNDQSIVSRMIRNILTREPAKVKSYGDLDEVDDEPHLVKGKDINEEQIRKEVDEILKNPDIVKPQTKDTDTDKADISEADLREAGPSGLSTVVEQYVMDSTDTDSD
ncbi:hypothetical protein TpMuguga_03g00638 [Theileria parva strain Muguga]|uniref:Uncharacterized protein n=1 Tax=Theileria parva TaxID=5875 RepID=Q4MZ53_THEPA|nr:uncharacterized protein TpMuguga_03g00638 [Theileria parva strain Muguga]EAN30479.1 hypothetical protein TpMuguga_03g00638 [Theileria parva strain Muguga]|eukprot:XP_762762.1 hypothetical protein [Theileria parva strain Muguga]